MLKYDYQPVDGNLDIKKKYFSSQYFSGCEASIYFDNRFISECKEVSFSMIENVLPIYGYASYTPDVWARGTRLVQGSFTINMFGVNYLNEFVNKYSKKTTSTNFATPEVSQYLIQNKDKKAVDSMKMRYWNNDYSGFKSNVTTSVVDLADIPFFKESSFDILITYKILDIRQVLNEGISEFIQSIDDVHLTSVMTTGIDTSGKPIEQVYSFLAGDYNRSKRFIENQQPTK